MSLDTYEKLRHAIEEALDADGYRHETGDYMIIVDRGKVVDITEVHVGPGEHNVALQRNYNPHSYTVVNFEDIDHGDIDYEDID